MRITGTGFEFFGKKYENDNENTSAATTISEAQSELSTFFGKEINKEKLSQITETEAATNNSEEREQVLTTAAALYIVKREYTESLNASSRALSSRKFSQSASAMLKAAAKSLNETKKNANYEKQYKDLIAKAESLDAQSENLWLQEVTIEAKTDELKSVTEQAQEVTATIKQVPEELRKDEELAALIDRAIEFDAAAEELYSEHKELAKESKNKVPQYTAEIAQDENNNTVYNIFGDDNSKSTMTTDSEGNIYIKNESGDEATLTFNENNKIKNTVIKKQNQSITTIEADENEVPFIQEYEINSNNETLVYEQGIDSANNLYYAFNQDEDEDPILGEYELMIAEDNYSKDSENETDGEFPGVDLPESIENEDSATDESELPKEYEEEGTVSIPDDEIEVIENPKDEEIEKALTEAEETSEIDKTAEEELIQEKGYNRQDPTRNAIANHDEVYVYNGLENGLEENYKGVLLDLDTYYDQFSYLGGDSQEYSSNVQYAIERDISNYFDIDLSSSTAQEELKSVYRQMLNNANLDEPDIENAYEYNAAAKKLFLGLSTDKCFENDYISLDGIKVGAEPQKQAETQPKETEKPVTEEKPETKEEVKKEEKEETKKSEETKKAEKTEETKKEEKTKSKEEAKKPETKEEVKKEDKKETKAAKETKKTEKTEETKKAEKTEAKEEVKKEEKKETKEAPKQESKPRTNNIKDNKINLNDYFNEFHEGHKKRDDKYIEEVQKALKTDIANNFGINLSEKDGIKNLKSICEQIAYEANIDVDEKDDEKYINKVTKKLAKYSWDGHKSNDKINLEDMEIGKKLPKDKLNRKKIVEYAKKFVGMSEQEVEKATGREFDDGMWCSDFTQMVLENTCGEKKLPKWYNKCPNTGYSETILASARAAGCATTNPDKVQPGDLVIFLYPDGTSYHTAMVDHIEGDTLYTIEGNYTDGLCCEVERDKHEANMIYVRMIDKK